MAGWQEGRTWAGGGHVCQLQRERAERKDRKERRIIHPLWESDYPQLVSTRPVQMTGVTRECCGIDLVGPEQH